MTLSLRGGMLDVLLPEITILRTQPSEFWAVKRAVAVVVLAILALVLLLSKHIIAATTFLIILLSAPAVLVYFVFIWPNLRRRS